SGIVGSLAQVAASASSPVPIIGASGAVAGILGAYIVLFPRNRVRTVIILFYFLRVVDVPAAIVLGMWFILQFFNGLAAIARVSSGGVAWFAHLGGFALGIVAGILARSQRRSAIYV
ncbi:MAG: rhomboid family intramembrane serine protease, partial [Chloroflexi bacterium]|nr:rhomboid family intramembrane serine protease [Chloroflexota bacterium]